MELIGTWDYHVHVMMLKTCCDVRRTSIIGIRGSSNISLSSSWATRPGQAFQKVEDLFQDGQDPDFWPESMSPFYTLPTGARSCYNHVVMAGLQVFGSQLTFLLMFTFCKYQLHWINAECDVQAFVEADGEADLDVYRAVIR